MEGQRTQIQFQKEGRKEGPNQMPGIVLTEKIPNWGLGQKKNLLRHTPVA